MSCIYTHVLFFVKEYNLILSGKRGVHSRGAGRHAGGRYSNRIGTLGKQAADIFYRNMALYDVSIHNSCMAGAEPCRNTFIAFDFTGIFNKLFNYSNTVISRYSAHFRQHAHPSPWYIVKVISPS